MDRTTKLLLGAIALGLWINIAAPLLRPTSVKAQTQFQNNIFEIAATIKEIADGSCTNRVICHQ
jgi:hypothetical protein